MPLVSCDSELSPMLLLSPQSLSSFDLGTTKNSHCSQYVSGVRAGLEVSVSGGAKVYRCGGEHVEKFREGVDGILRVRSLWRNIEMADRAVRRARPCGVRLRRIGRCRACSSKAPTGRCGCLGAAFGEILGPPSVDPPPTAGAL